MLPQQPGQPQQPQRQPQQGQGQQAFRQGDIEAKIAYIMRRMGVTREQAIAMLRQRMQGQPQGQTMQPQQGGQPPQPQGRMPV